VRCGWEEGREKEGGGRSTCRAIQDQEDLVDALDLLLDGLVAVCQLLHEPPVGVQPPRGVADDHIHLLLYRLAKSERDLLQSTHTSSWEHSSHFRLIGRGVPSVSLVSQLVHQLLW